MRQRPPPFSLCDNHCHFLGFKMRVNPRVNPISTLFHFSLLKVRVGEWDASGFNAPEQFNHEEYTVVRILKHPQFNAGRLSNDIALLYTDR